MKKKLYLFGALLALSALMAYSQDAAESCRSALTVCGKVIIPSLFPYFVLTHALSRLGLPALLGRVIAPFARKLYGISGAGASALPIGLLGGYPSGAAYIAELQKSGAVTVSEGERLLAFCNNSGPAFIIGVIGVGVFGSVRTGMLLYLSHIAAALITGLFFRSRDVIPYEPECFLDTGDMSDILPESIRQAVTNILSVCGFVVFFTTLTGLIDAGGSLSYICGRISQATGAELHFTRAFLIGLMELGSSAGVMAGLTPSPASVALAAFILGWGGLSVHMQTKALISGSKLKGTLHMAGRLISASLGALTAGVLYYIVLRI